MTGKGGWRRWVEHFDRLSVRKKMMVMHNFFFLILSLTLFLLLRPVYNEIVETAQERTERLVLELMRNAPEELALIKSDWYVYRQGRAEELGISTEARRWLEAHPDSVWTKGYKSEVYVRWNRSSNLWIAVNIDRSLAERMVMKFNIMLVLGLLVMYTIGVLALELIILPYYVYSPIRDLLEADAALQRGDRERELVDIGKVRGDEFGRIIASRNLVVTLFRRHEEELTSAMVALEEVAADLKRKNHLLETAKQNLADQDRLVSLGMLSAGVAHELNTPLAVLQGSIQKLLETATDSITRERLYRMLRVAERLRSISESLIDFARARTQTVEPVELRPLLDEAWALVQIEPDAGQVIFHNRVEEGCTILGNSDRLLQVYVNLFRNSVNAVGGQGNIYVSARSYRNDRDWIVLSVEDDGPGIEPEILPAIFEPFITSNLDSRGTGLGLAVAEGIIQQHGGVIVASNRPEGGARFEVTLPASTRKQFHADENRNSTNYTT